MTTDNFQEVISQIHSQDVLDIDFRQNKIHRLDLSIHNTYLANTKHIDTRTLAEYIQKEAETHHAKICIGGYGENRIIYRKSKHFGKDNDLRSIHLGIDIWYETGTKVLAPIDGKVHSFNNNSNFGDYGPTIILEHKIEGFRFFTLYGHLSKNSLQHIQENQGIKAGDIFAHLGSETENGNWPPHLHFQLIRDMGNLKGDFPGVCKESEWEKYRKICPNPELLLRFKS
jgi:peptidoglycan LD-endopeptidase LytH